MRTRSMSNSRIKQQTRRTYLPFIVFAALLIIGALNSLPQIPQLVAAMDGLPNIIPAAILSLAGGAGLVMVRAMWRETGQRFA